MQQIEVASRESLSITTSFSFFHSKHDIPLFCRTNHRNVPAHFTLKPVQPSPASHESHHICNLQMPPTDCLALSSSPPPATSYGFIGGEPQRKYGAVLHVMHCRDQHCMFALQVKYEARIPKQQINTKPVTYVLPVL
ncbi:hypothetical protein WAI453_002032 [Rhynchosporium graminicola]